MCILDVLNHLLKQDIPLQLLVHDLQTYLYISHIRTFIAWHRGALADRQTDRHGLHSLALWNFVRQTDRQRLHMVVMTKACEVQLKPMDYLMHYFSTRMKQSCMK